MHSHMNLAAALIDRRLDRGDASRVAVECGDLRWTYGELAALVNRAANGFRSMGIAPGERVLLVLPDSIEFISAFLGAVRIGAVAVPCSTFLGEAHYSYFLRETQARVLVTTTGLVGHVEPAPATSPGVRTIVVGDQDGSDRRLAWSAWIAAASPAMVEADTRGDDLAFWLWTSGTTGEPKAAVHRHQDPPWCCQLLGEQVLEMSAADRVFSAAKLFHAYGLGNGLFFPFWTGATTILYPGRATADAAYATLHSARPTIFFGVPTLYAAMLRIDDAERRFDLSSLRCCVSAAEPLPAELFVRWRARFGSEILDGIGSTEMLHQYICSRRGGVRPGSAGVPVPGYEIKIVDEQGAPVGVNQTGDLLVKGPSRAVMYWNRPEETRKRMRGDWFVTGDKFSVDADGYFWYAGRSDDMFKVSGEWVSPTEIEGLLIEHRSVLECAVVPWPESSGVLKVKACVVLKDGGVGSDLLADALRAHVRARTAHYKCPRVIEFLSELPKTATGKIQRFKLRKDA